MPDGNDDKEYDAMKFVGGDWVKFTKVEGENVNVVLVPRGKIKYIKQKATKNR